MKVAISTDGNAVSAHFGRCPTFTLVEIDDSGNILSKESIDNPGHNPGFLPEFFAGKGVVLEISKVTNPSHPGSKGVTLVIIPQRAYVDFPTQMVITFSGMRKYSNERPKANEFGGMIQTSPL